MGNVRTGAWKEIQLDFHNFIVIEEIGMRFATENSKHKKRYVKVKCKLCDLEYEGQYALFKSRDKVCRCESKKGKGMIAWSNPDRDRILSIRRGMIYRCHNEKSPAYKKYGEKGIHVCTEWLDSPEEFYQWSLYNDYKDNLTIDRINNEKGYHPDNCRWITKEEQAYNTRRITTFDDVKKIKELLSNGIRHKEISNITGVSINVIRKISCKSSWSKI
jgi:hypothetical protein